MITSMVIIVVFSMMIYKVMSFGVNFNSKSSSFKKLFKFIPKTGGEKITLMSKKCEVCGNKTIFLDGEDTSSLKVINIVDPDSGKMINKMACDDCYEKFLNLLKKEKTNKVKLSKELNELAELIKNS